MLKKIVISIMMICMLIAPVLHVQAGLLDDLIEQGSDFGESSASEKEAEYLERIEALNKEYNDKKKEIENDSSLSNAKKQKKLKELKSEYDDKKAAAAETIGGSISNFVLGDVKDVVWGIGNLIFAGVTVILGVKYIWSSAEGKSQVMESLPTFVLAVVFFYLADPLFDFIIEVTGGVAGADDWRELSGNVIWVINTIVKYLALGGLIFMGVRYLLASAEGKASLKTNMGGLVIGVLFVFLSTNVVNFIIEMGSDIL